MMCAPEFTQKFVHLQCKNCTDINIVVPINFTLAQLHMVLVDTLRIPIAFDEPYHFQTSRPSTTLISPLIKYYPNPSPYHHDGWILPYQTGIYLEHPHPHAPFEPNSSSECSEIRDANLWPLSLVLDINEMSKITYLLEDFEPIVLVPTHIESISNNDNPYLTMDNQCSLCMRAQCSSNTPCHITSCCDHCQFASKLSLPFLQDQSMDFTTVSSELNDFIVSQLHELAKALQLETKRHTSNPHTPCHWIEATGESCVYCTENYL